MRILGLDYGDRKIGVAVSDAFGWTAQGVEVLNRTASEQDLERLREIVEQHEVTEIVLGLPKNMNGSIGPRAEICMAFAEELKHALGLPVTLWDERLSTAMVERTLIAADISRKKRKQVVDKMAAAVILQSYLDTKPK
ncbi:putative pre-16S rRNA nuclease [Xylanibacillus composti]|uniref:Putative pre-16S rRNA nuclease n=1 Tax=Xylanibacillus composti TaxID=1572762 RepID=A0A8J4H363_9BACL|nr:Holliday junction resolvase RuvX [Xylanibacillus composti]GIQ70108.1 putative pre-16S rRNA nuclease [Xylanibacillus composti]